jgi:tRNA-Thr(GGU) m(6)t(6)A37 methyltransferase TsaA
MQPTLQFIGTIHSSLKTLDDCPLQENENAPEASIQMLPAFTEGVRDIQPGQEVVLLTWLHMADRTVTTCYPRKNRDAPHIGVFSTRSPDRPNPIGLHTAKVLSVSGAYLKVSGLEVLDQTPLLDIKPALSR